MVFDHIGFNVTDFPRTRAFLLQALQPLGIVVTAEGEGWAMIGRPVREPRTERAGVRAFVMIDSRTCRYGNHSMSTL